MTVCRDGQAVPPGSARQRAVLGLLALHARSGVHRDAIVDVLWPERPPVSAVAEVQGYLSRLRKLLSGPAGPDLVIRAGASYRLRAGAARLDLAVFGELTRAAREAAARQDLAFAFGQYEQALALWRGDILADVDLLRRHPATIEAERRRAEAVLGCAEAAASTAASDRALPHLRELCAREPLNEPAHAQLMITLDATGQQATALQVFTDLRHRLDAELGIVPGPLLVRVQIQILRQEIYPPRG